MFRILGLFVVVIAIADGARFRTPTVAKKGDLNNGKWVVALDRNMKTQVLIMLKANQTLAPGLALPKDPCANLECEELECPGGFSVQPAEGHCCPYCVNPNLKIERIIKGPTGEFGGKYSVFCRNVMCFPTMCTQAEMMPSGHSAAGDGLAGEGVGGGHDQGTVCCPECHGGAGRDLAYKHSKKGHM